MSDSPEYPGTNSIAGNYTSPSVANTKMGSDAQNTTANSDTQTPDGQPQPAADLPTTTEGEFNAGQPGGEGTGAPSGQPAGTAINPDDAGAAPPAASKEPDTYGGNFGNDVQNVANDPNRAANQASSINRGAFGEQGQLGATHGGYGNQFREFDTAAERPAAEAAEEKYYGDGASRPGPQHNSYQNYDGQDNRPVEQGHAVRDTPTPPATSSQPSFGDGRGNSQDTRNLPGKDGPDAAFQNDNGAPTVGAAYAEDYGHTSGAGLPPGTPDNHLKMGPNGHGETADDHSSRGGYDNQGAGGGRAGHGAGAPAGQDAPAPLDAPGAPQGEGYGHERSEQTKPGNPDTGDSRNGFGPGGSKEGNTSQGYGSKGGSYDDQNPGARGPAYDDYTKEEKSENYGQEARQDFRPEGGDEPKSGDYGPAPRRNDGRDKQKL